MSNGGSIGKIIGIAAGAVVLVGGGVFLGVHFSKGDNNTTVQETAPAVTAASETQPEFVVIPAESTVNSVQIIPIEQTTAVSIALESPVSAAAAPQAGQPVVSSASLNTYWATVGDGLMCQFNVNGTYDYWIASLQVRSAGDAEWGQGNVDSRTINSGKDAMLFGSATVEIRASIVPYMNNGTAGKPYSVSWSGDTEQQAPQTQPSQVLQRDSDGIVIPNSYSGYSAYSSPKSGYCNVASCYIRNSADTNGTKTEQRSLYKLDPCVIYGEVNGFYYISTDSGSGYDYYGYVQKSNLKIGTPPADPNRNYNATSGYVSADSANLRSTPSKENNSNVICSVKKGMTFTVLSFDGYWYYISCEKGYGYLSYKMVTVK